MKIKLSKIIIIALLSGIAAQIIFSVDRELSFDQAKKYPSGLFSDYSDVKIYRINSEKILESIQNGEKNIFEPLEVDFSHDSSLVYKKPFSWSQSDYLTIVNTLHQYSLHESLDDWSLLYFGFYGDCKYNPLGFDTIEVEYFKSVGLEYITRKIGIYPLIEEVVIGDGATFPRMSLLGWQTANPNNFIVEANEALNLAENNGGKEFRLAIDNECRIFVTFSPKRLTWEVSYSPNKQNLLSFEISIGVYGSIYKILDRND